MSTEPTPDLSAFNLLDDQTRECPFPYLKAIREQSPVYFMPELNGYYVSRYADLRYVKKHPELFSNDIYSHNPNRSAPRSAAEAYRADNGWARVSTLQRTDPPVHTKYRQLINHAFTVARIRQMTGYIESVVNDLIDDFIDGFENQGHCDFVRQFTVPLPCTVIADQLGVPKERIWDLKRWSDAMLAPGGGFVDEAEALECGKQVVEAQQFFASVIEERQQQPQDDIITDLANATVIDNPDAQPRPLTMFELQDLLEQLLTGGNETTTNAIGSALMLLLQRPGSIAKLQAQPELIRNFVEETLRVETPVIHLFRVATQDTEIDGVGIPKGSTVLLGYASANRDESVFNNAEEFDLKRNKPGAHLAFGSGPHHCPGAALARQELYSTFVILLQRLKNIRVADPAEEFKHIPHSFLRGLGKLEIQFDIHQRERYLPGKSVY